ncbi:MAG: DNA polymerase III subunit gamma/tau, partial [Alphaproteobacteria bacterium]
VTPSVADGAAVSEIERTRGGELAAELSIPVLSRTWQFLLKGLEDLRTAPSPLQAAEMVLVRLAHVADLPPPGDLIRELRDRPRSDAVPSTPLPAGDATASAPTPSAGPAGVASVDEPATPVTGAASAPAKARRETSPARAVATDPTDFRAVVELFEARREVQIRNHLYHNVRLVRFEPGRLEISLDDHAPPDLPGQVLKHLRAWCGPHWQVTVAEPTDASMTLAEQDRAAERARLSTAREHPLVRAALETFPGARIERVKPLGGAGVEHDPLPAEPETGDED